MLRSLSHKRNDLTLALIRAHGLRSGHWGLALNFHTIGMNLSVDGASTRPALGVAVEDYVLQEFATAQDFTLDAALVNPAPVANEFPRELDVS